MIREYLKQPYPIIESKWKLIVSISAFVPLFIFVFQPFQLSELHSDSKIYIISGYGLVTFVILTFNLFTIPIILKKQFKENGWTVQKQIILVVWIIYTIGLANFLYSSIFFAGFRSIWGLAIFQMYTLTIGVFPTVIITILGQNARLAYNLKCANDLNNTLEFKANESGEQQVCIVADNEKDRFDVSLSNLLYIESTGNYIEVYYLKEDKPANLLLRCALKRAEAQLEKHPAMFKCHRAFIVNINKIIQLKGNSQGVRLILKNLNIEIPVSRNSIKPLKDTLKLYQ